MPDGYNVLVVGAVLATSLCLVSFVAGLIQRIRHFLQALGDENIACSIQSYLDYNRDCLSDSDYVIWADLAESFRSLSGGSRKQERWSVLGLLSFCFGAVAAVFWILYLIWG